MGKENQEVNLGLNAMAIEHIASVCHEANRAFCETIGDDSQVPWKYAPDWQKKSAIEGVIFHLNGDHGPEASHEHWMKAKLKDGWVYGAVKDPDAKTHPCLVPFDQLPTNQQQKDYLFRSNVRGFKEFFSQVRGDDAQPEVPSNAISETGSPNQGGTMGANTKKTSGKKAGGKATATKKVAAKKTTKPAAKKKT